MKISTYKHARFSIDTKKLYKFYSYSNKTRFTFNLEYYFPSIPNSPNIFPPEILSFEKEISPPSTPWKKLDPRESYRKKSGRKFPAAENPRQARSARLQERCCNPRCNELTIFLPTGGGRKRVRNEFEARVDRFVIAVDPLFAKRLFLLARLSASSLSLPPSIHRLFRAVPWQTASPVYRERTLLSLLSSPRF